MFYTCIMITAIIKKFLPKDLPKPMGRWRIEECSTALNQKIDLSNEDHCGPCGQYALEKKNDRDVGRITSRPIDSFPPPS